MRGLTHQVATVFACGEAMFNLSDYQLLPIFLGSKADIRSIIAIVGFVPAAALSVVWNGQRNPGAGRREEKSAGAGCEVEIVDYFGTATNRAPVKLPSEPTMGA
jgi:hypothetical protein